MLPGFMRGLSGELVLLRVGPAGERGLGFARGSPVARVRECCVTELMSVQELGGSRGRFPVCRRGDLDGYLWG